MNLVVRDESEKLNEEGNVVEEGGGKGKVLNREEEMVFSAIAKMGKRPKLEVPVFSGNLNPDELINWNNELEEYFEYEDIEDPDRIKFAKARLKGHAKI